MPHTGPDGQIGRDGCGHVITGCDGQMNVADGHVNTGCDGHANRDGGGHVITGCVGGHTISEGQVMTGRDGGHRISVEAGGQVVIGRLACGHARWSAACASTHPWP